MQYSLHDVFISYRRFEDKERTNDLGTRLAGAIYRFLTKKGLRVFWDDPEMEPGDFEEQLYWQIEHSPNYILIGTEAAKRFRPDVKDFVAEEVRLALKLYHASPNKDRVVTHVLPKLSKEEQEKAAAAGPYPEEIQGLMNLHGVQLHDELPTDKDLSDILKHVTRVNRGNMWNAGHHWFEQSRKAGHRFASLSINKSIMPNANIQRQEDVRLPIRAHGDGQADLPLLEMIEKTPGHLYLIGEGGIGKTTALYSIMEDVYGGDLPTGSMEQLRLNGQVPLFVELSRAPDTYGKLYEGGKSTFIHRAVYQQLRQDLSAKQVPGSAVRRLDEVFEIDPETAVNPIHDLFTQQSPAPEYLLLLDGLNEVSRVVIEHKEEPEMKSAVVTMILQEIHQLMTECPNVRVILTSRSKEQTNWGDETTLLYLSGVNDDSVKDYLVKSHVSHARIESAMNNEKLRDVLRVPLFLTLYAALDGDEELLTQGEILHLFFHQKKKALYSTRTRIDQVDEDVDKAASAKQFHRLTATMQGFIVDFILPEIAWRMEQNDMFHIYRIGDEDEVNLSSIIEHVLTDESDTAVCGRYAEAFEEYLSDSDAVQDTLAIAEDMIERLGGRMRRVVDSILNCAVMTLGILQKNGDEYGFIHHHIRDYFAAVYQINRLKLAVYLQKRKKNELARECLSDWKAAPLHAEVRRFIGEALGEAHNAPVCDDEGNWHYVVPEEPCGRNLIKRGFDIYRGRFEGEDGYAVWNLLEIIKNVRKDFSGVDLTSLNLSGCVVSGIPLGRRGCKCKLSDAKIDQSFFLQLAEAIYVSRVGFHPDGKHIVTVSKKRATVWNVHSMYPICSVCGHAEAITDAAFSRNGRYIITVSWDGTAKVWDWRVDLSREIATLKHNGKVSSVVCSPKGTCFVTTSVGKRGGGVAKIWNAESFALIGKMEWHSAKFESIHFSCEDTIVTILSNKLIKTWNAKTLRPIRTIKLHSYDEVKQYSAYYSSNGRFSITGNGEICDAMEEKVIGSVDSTELLGKVIAISDDGKKVVTISDGVIEVLTVETGLKTSHDYSHGSELISVSDAFFSSNDKSIAIVTEKREVMIWDAVSLRFKGLIRLNKGAISSASFNKNGDSLLLSSKGNGYEIWNALTLRMMKKVETDSERVDYAFYGPEEKTILAVSTYKHVATVFDARTHRPLRSCTGFGKWLFPVSISPDGKIIAALSKDDSTKIDVWDYESLKLIHPALHHKGRVNSMSFSPDGSRFVTSSWEDYTSIWDVSTHKQRAGKYTHGGGIVRFSYDGKYIMYGSGTIALILDSVTMRKTGMLRGHSSDIKSITCSHDSRFIITTSFDRTAKIWDAETFECLHTIHNIPGLEVIGVDLRHLHPDSRLSDEVKERLYEYGAIVDERG